uniref:Melanotropin alpha n=3 Tax=Unidentata TaxID=1329950 RepID=MLA_ANOCA|nr:RecName: Full=Melanotropin alpha; AltName: Full=Alpha-MSH [Anolis carolinensis]
SYAMEHFRWGKPV